MNITSENFFILAAKAYQPVCLSKDDFIKDVRAISYMRADINRYQKTNNRANLRTILNRFIVASNNFGPIDAMKFSFYVVRANESHVAVLRTIYMFLGIIPETVQITDDLIVDDKFIIDDDLMKELRNVVKIC
jgi:hypothetical protein